MIEKSLCLRKFELLEKKSCGSGWDGTHGWNRIIVETCREGYASKKRKMQRV